MKGSEKKNILNISRLTKYRNSKSKKEKMLKHERRKKMTCPTQMKLTNLALLMVSNSCSKGWNTYRIRFSYWHSRGRVNLWFTPSHRKEMWTWDNWLFLYKNKNSTPRDYCRSWRNNNYKDYNNKMSNYSKGINNQKTGYY